MAGKSARECLCAKKMGQILWTWVNIQQHFFLTSVYSLDIYKATYVTQS